MSDAVDGHELPAPYVSTGQLPPPDDVARLVKLAHMIFGANNDGQTSSVYPVLEAADPHLFGICLASVTGWLVEEGDTVHPFAIMSVSKPFVFALIAQKLGVNDVRARLGANATGLPFNSVEAIERSADGRTNPMVNPGAISAVSLAPGRGEDRWQFIVQGLSRFAGRQLSLSKEVYVSASATNQRNQAIARLLAGAGRIEGDPDEALDLYTRQCSLNVTARDVALMGATLADGGVQPVTRERILDEDVCQRTLAVMATAGMYETSGDWLYDVGLPGKSGIGGGIVTVSPGKGGMATFAPLIDEFGNSIKGQLATRFLSRQLGLSLFASLPV
jgi:glutaminase